MYLNYIHKSIDNGEIVGAGEHLDDFFYNFYKPNQLASIFMYYMQFDDNAPIDFHAKMYAIYDAFLYSYQFLNDEFEED